MKILIVSCLYPPYEPNGGASIHAHQLAQSYQSLGHSVSVYCGRLSTKIPLHTVLNDKHEGINITRIVLNYESFDRPIERIVGAPQILESFKKVLSNTRPDLVHFHSIQGLGADIVNHTTSEKIRTVITCHDSWWICPRQFFLKSDKKTFCTNKNLTDCSLCYSFLEDKKNISKNIRKEAEVINRDTYLYNIFNNIDYVVFPSNFIKNIYKKYFHEKNWLVSQNGIPKYKKYSTQKSNKIKFLYIGGNSDEKGTSLLLDTWHKYFSIHSQIELNIYGGGSQYLIPIINTPNINIFNLYDHQQLPKIFGSHSYLIYPSIIPENSPVTIKEAFAFGLPVIGSDIGGIPELIQDGYNGFVFKSNDQNSLEKAINKAIESNRIILSKNSFDSIKYIDDQAKEILEFVDTNISGSIIKPKVNNKYLHQLRNSFYQNSYIQKSNDSLIKITYFKLIKTNDIPKKILLFNLDKNRAYIYEKYLKNIKYKYFHEIVEQQTPYINKNFINVLKTKIFNWIKIYQSIKNNKINTVIFPIPDKNHLLLINKILFIFFGVKYYVFLDKKVIAYKLNPTAQINRKINTIKRIKLSYKYLNKISTHFIYLHIFIIFNIKAIFTTRYGLSRIVELTDKINLKNLFIKLMIIPLEIIQKIGNYFLINYLL